MEDSDRSKTTHLFHHLKQNQPSTRRARCEPHLLTTTINSELNSCLTRLNTGLTQEIHYVEHNLKKPTCTHTGAAGCHHRGNWCLAASERNLRCERGVRPERRREGGEGSTRLACVLPCQHSNSVEAGVAKRKSGTRYSLLGFCTTCNKLCQSNSVRKQLPYLRVGFPVDVLVFSCLVTVTTKLKLHHTCVSEDFSSQNLQDAWGVHRKQMPRVSRPDSQYSSKGERMSSSSYPKLCKMQQKPISIIPHSGVNVATTPFTGAPDAEMPTKLTSNMTDDAADKAILHPVTWHLK